jgi:CheY-like chemotaxis protein
MQTFSPTRSAVAGAAAPVTIVVAMSDPTLAALVQRDLEGDGYDVIVATAGPTALQFATRIASDVIVLDQQLPGLDGLEVCRRLRRVSDACVLLLTADAHEAERILGESIGADDILVKPFDPRELNARVKALLRRPRRDEQSSAADGQSSGIGDEASSNIQRPTSSSPLPTRPSISAVLPAYNEQALIEQAVRRVAGVLRDLTDDYEIVVTNDGSRDQTGEILAALQATEPDLHLRIVTHPANQGYGAALASGFDAARKELIFMTDGDEQFDVAELARLLPAMDDVTDLVIGWREQRADPPVRLFNAWGWKQLINGLFGYTARDVDCAFKLFRRSVWRSVTVHARGATFSAELLIKARRLGFQIKELPVHHFPRTAGSATGARPDVIVQAFVELFQLWRHLDAELVDDLRSAVRNQPSAISGQPHAV